MACSNGCALHAQVMAFDQFCANVQRDVGSVLAMLGNTLEGRDTGGPVICGVNTPMVDASVGKDRVEPVSQQEPDLASRSEPELIVTISDLESTC